MAGSIGPIPGTNQRARTNLLHIKNHQLHALRARLRERRHRPLCRLIAAMPPPVTVLDVGGSPFFWESIAEADRCRVTMLNLEEATRHEVFRTARFTDFRLLVGDARHMPEIDTDSYDLVVCNSTLEHVGNWPSMVAAANELCRVGKHGWVQIPAIEFPLETHLLLPFVHWFNRPLQRRAVELLLAIPPNSAREKVDSINLVSRREMRLLFPHAAIRSERLLLFAKSHLAIW